MPQITVMVNFNCQLDEVLEAAGLLGMPVGGYLG